MNGTMTRRRRLVWTLRLPATYLALFLAAFIYVLNALAAPCQDPDCLSAFRGLTLPGLLLLPWIDFIRPAPASIFVVYGLPLVVNASIFAAIGYFVDRRAHRV